VSGAACVCAAKMKSNPVKDKKLLFSETDKNISILNIAM